MRRIVRPGAGLEVSGTDTPLAHAGIRTFGEGDKVTLWLMFGQFLVSSPSWDSRTHISALGTKHCPASVSGWRPV